MNKDIKYILNNHKVRLKQNYFESYIYLDFQKNLIIIAGRKFDTIQNYLKNEFNDPKIKREIDLLKNLYDKNKNAKELIITAESLGKGK